MVKTRETFLNIVLYEPQIPPNTGNVARLSVAARCALHLIHPLGFQADEAAARRAGLDYWPHVQLFHYENWQDFLKKTRAKRLHFFSKKVSRPYTHAQYRRGDYLIFGSETQGLPESLLEKNIPFCWTIPMWGETRSLNLATSVGIVTYEALRQIHQGFSAVD